LHGYHWIVEYHNCSAREESGGLIINNHKKMLEILVNSAKLADTTILKKYSRQFEPQGATAVVVISESHLSIHTWPEDDYSADFDFFCCNPNSDGDSIVDYVSKEIGAESYHCLKLKRTKDRSEVIPSFAYNPKK